MMRSSIDVRIVYWWCHRLWMMASSTWSHHIIDDSIIN